MMRIWILLIGSFVSATPLDDSLKSLAAKVEEITMERSVYRAIAEGSGYLCRFRKDHAGVWRVTIRHNGELLMDDGPVYDKR